MMLWKILKRLQQPSLYKVKLAIKLPVENKALVCKSTNQNPRELGKPIEAVSFHRIATVEQLWLEYGIHTHTHVDVRLDIDTHTVSFTVSLEA